MKKIEELATEPIGWNWEYASEVAIPDWRITANFEVKEQKATVSIQVKGESIVFETREAVDVFINGLIGLRDEAFSKEAL